MCVKLIWSYRSFAPAICKNSDRASVLIMSASASEDLQCDSFHDPLVENSINELVDIDLLEIQIEGEVEEVKEVEEVEEDNSADYREVCDGAGRSSNDESLMASIDTVELSVVETDSLPESITDAMNVLAVECETSHAAVQEPSSDSLTAASHCIMSSIDNVDGLESDIERELNADFSADDFDDFVQAEEDPITAMDHNELWMELQREAESAASGIPKMQRELLDIVHIQDRFRKDSERLLELYRR